MPEAMPLIKATPPANHQCPLCGQLNRCAPADTGDYASPCWCKSQTFPPELLAQVEPEQRNKSCICQACFTRFNASALDES